MRSAWLLVLTAYLLFGFPHQASSQVMGCGGNGAPDFGVLNSFDTQASSHYGPQYIQNTKNRYDAVISMPVDPACKQALDRAYSCCMDIDTCGGYTGALMASTGETSDVGLRSQNVRAILEAQNAAARGALMCQAQRQHCSQQCGAADPNMRGNVNGQLICDGMEISEHQGNKLSVERLTRACTSLNGLNKAAVGSINFMVVCSAGEPSICSLASQ